jgi:hypothetical protein
LLQIVPAAVSQGDPEVDARRFKEEALRAAKKCQYLLFPKLSQFEPETPSIALALMPGVGSINCYSYNAPSGELHRRATDNLGFAADHH